KRCGLNLKHAPIHDAKRAALIAASDRCERIAAATINPSAMLDELRRALAVLTDEGPSEPPPRGRPVLRLIEGGLSKNLARFFHLRTFGLTAARLNGCGLSLSRLTARLNASAERIHEINDLRGFAALGTLDWLTGLLLLDQFLERVLVLVFEFVRLEVTCLRLDDM